MQKHKPIEHSFGNLHHRPAYPAGPEDDSTGRSYPVSSSTPERGLSERKHTVDKMGDHQSSRHQVPLLHYTTRAKYHECPSKNLLDPWFGLQTAVSRVPLSYSWGVAKTEEASKEHEHENEFVKKRWEWYYSWCYEIKALHCHSHTIWEWPAGWLYVLVGGNFQKHNHDLKILP